MKGNYSHQQLEYLIRICAPNSTLDSIEQHSNWKAILVFAWIMDYSFSGEVTTESNEQMTLLMDNLKDKKDNDRYNANKLLLLFDWNNNSTDKMVNDTMTQIRFNHSNTSLMLSPNQLIPDLINITQSTPLEYAMVMYGYIMPFLLLLTIVANTLIVLVLAQKHMRSPTNLVLLWMAVADMLTLVCPSPWYFYMYTLGYHRHVLHPTAACYIFNTMTDILPIAFHTASIWLTILLAGQRFDFIIYLRTKVSIMNYLLRIIGHFVFALELCSRLKCHLMDSIEKWLLSHSLGTNDLDSHLFFTQEFWAWIYLLTILKILNENFSLSQ